MYSASSEPGNLFHPRPLQNRVAEFWAILRFIQLHPWAPNSVHSVRPAGRPATCATVPAVPKISQVWRPTTCAAKRDANVRQSATTLIQRVNARNAVGPSVAKFFLSFPYPAEVYATTCNN